MNFRISLRLLQTIENCSPTLIQNSYEDLNGSGRKFENLHMSPMLFDFSQEMSIKWRVSTNGAHAMDRNCRCLSTRSRRVHPEENHNLRDK